MIKGSFAMFLQWEKEKDWLSDDSLWHWFLLIARGSRHCIGRIGGSLCPDYPPVCTQPDCCGTILVLIVLFLHLLYFYIAFQSKAIQDLFPESFWIFPARFGLNMTLPMKSGGSAALMAEFNFGRSQMKRISPPRNCGFLLRRGIVETFKFQTFHSLGWTLARCIPLPKVNTSIIWKYFSFLQQICKFLLKFCDSVWYLKECRGCWQRSNFCGIQAKSEISKTGRLDL